MDRIKNFLFNNTSNKQTAAKNTLWLFFGEIIGRIFKLAIVVFATRQLGVEGWGIFSYALAFVSFFYILGDFGINTFITREMSKDDGDKYQHLTTSFLLKTGLLLFLFAISLLVGLHVGKIKIGIEMLTTLSLLYFSDCFREFVLSVNRSLGKMEREALSKVLMNSIITVLGVVLLLKDATPLSLGIAYAVGSIVSTIYVVWAIRAELKKIDWKISKESIKIIYTFSWPVIVISLFSFVFSIDTIMLGQLRSAADVGLYSAAQRIVQFTGIVPAFIAMATFPILSRNESNNEMMADVFERVMAIVLSIGIPLAIGGFLLSTNLMSLVFGSDYAVGGITLGILMLSILASFPNTIITNVVFSKNLQRSFIAATAYGIGVNIILNFLLIPRYGPVGGAISVAITQIFIAAVNWQKLKKIMPFSIIPKIGMIALSCLFMAASILFLKGIGASLVIVVVSACAVYFASLYLLKEPSFTEVLSLIKK
jgi:O-antigen/teichoic acid export membrane protein